MDREKLVFSALKPLDLALGAAVSGVKATVGIDRVSDGFYDLFGKVLRPVYEKNNDLRTEGTELVPASGGVIFAINHQSWNDVQVVGATAPRRLRFLAKAEFIDWPILRHLIALSDSPFIRRGGDKEGMSQAVEALRAGKALAIFPEGTIPGEEDVGRHEVEPDTGLLRGHTGAVRLAAAAGVPIVPVGVTGTGASFPPEVYPRLELLEAPKKVPVTVRYGEPLSFDGLADATHEELRAATKRLMLAISDLIDHARGYVPIEVPAEPLPRHAKLGVLVLHGFTSSLRTVDGLAPRLEAAGLPFRMPVLRGHGTHYTDMATATAQDWYDDAEAALLELSREVDAVVVVGLSMGGLVAINLGIRHPDLVAGVATMAAALRFRDPLAGVAPLLSKVFKSWPSPESFNDPSLKSDCENYPRFMTESFGSLLNYAQETEKRLPQLRAPISIIHSKRDQVIAPISANIIYRDVASKHRELHWFERSGHEMGQDCEKEAVFDEVMGFVDRFTK